MRGKIYRFFFVEPLFKSRLMILTIAICVSLIEMTYLIIINKNIDEGKHRKLLIEKTVEMEHILYPGAARTMTITTQIADPIKIDGKLYVLKGIKEREGRLSALINDDVYQEGDVIKNYRITKITPDTVLFMNDKTKELKILRFGY